MIQIKVSNKPQLAILVSFLTNNQALNSTVSLKCVVGSRVLKFDYAV